MQQVNGTGMDALAVLVARLTAEGCSYEAKVYEAAEETKPSDRSWSVFIKGY